MSTESLGWSGSMKASPDGTMSAKAKSMNVRMLICD